MERDAIHRAWEWRATAGFTPGVREWSGEHVHIRTSENICECQMSTVPAWKFEGVAIRNGNGQLFARCFLDDTAKAVNDLCGNRGRELVEVNPAALTRSEELVCTNREVGRWRIAWDIGVVKRDIPIMPSSTKLNDIAPILCTQPATECLGIDWRAVVAGNPVVDPFTVLKIHTKHTACVRSCSNSLDGSAECILCIASPEGLRS